MPRRAFLVLLGIALSAFAKVPTQGKAVVSNGKMVTSNGKALVHA